MNIGADEGFLKNGEHPVLKVSSAGHALQVFINGQISGMQCSVTFQVLFSHNRA